MRAYIFTGLRLRACHGARCFSTSSILRCSKDEKLSALSMLRKKTGIPVIQVKKALVEFNNDVDEAEKWLTAEAKKEGWTRAQKLQGRPMSQGLIGLINSNGTTAMVEVNCETDFVAKNKAFQELLTTATMTCLEHGMASGQGKVMWNQEELCQLETEGGAPLQAILTGKMASILENMALRRAVFMRPKDKDTFTGAYIHFAGQDFVSVARDVLMGRYAGLVSFTHDKSPPVVGEEDFRLTCYEIGNQLAQHIVGMNPLLVGNAETDKPKRNKDKERRLIFQEFLLDEDSTVQNYLEENRVEVLDFVRYGLGEEEEEVGMETDDEDGIDVEEVTGEVQKEGEGQGVKVGG